MAVKKSLKSNVKSSNVSIISILDTNYDQNIGETSRKYSRLGRKNVKKAAENRNKLRLGELFLIFLLTVFR